MRILIAHNAYLHRGGEDACVENESNVLREAGLDVTLHRVANTRSVAGVQAALAAPLGGLEEGLLEKKLTGVRPDILHVHNLYPLFSPRLFRVAHQQNIKTVLTLHNFRPLCMNGLFMTPNGEICERCAPGNFAHGIWRGCYRSSIPQSLGMAAHLTWASVQHWYDDVDLFIAPSEFLKAKYVSYGFPKEKIKVQGHFLAQWPTDPVASPDEDILYLGRLSEEKGIRWLATTFMNSKSEVTLKIAGDGPLRSWVENLRHPQIRYVGPLSAEAKANAICTSRAIVLASQCYENFPMVVPEANSYGVPAIVPNRGAMKECVASGINGKQFEAENPDSFWNTLQSLHNAFSTIDSRETIKAWAYQQYSKETFLKVRLALYDQIPHLASTQ